MIFGAHGIAHPGSVRHVASLVLLWGVALGWLTRVLAAWRGLPRVPDLLAPTASKWPRAALRLAVIVPACNEQGEVAACLRSLARQTHPDLHILAVDDRSTDRTAAEMQTVQAEHPGRITMLRVATLPPGWLGKTHAMHLAAEHALHTLAPDCLLFTDADVHFAPDALALALAALESTRADHLVLVPTTTIRRWDEAALLSLFQIFGLWAARPWRVGDPAAPDAIGIGAFNLVRTAAYRAVGGFAALPMAIVEDLTLGRRVKAAGLRQQAAFGRGLVRVHWAAGAPGLVRVLTKNVFAGANYSVLRLLGGVVWLLGFVVAPFAGLASPLALAVPAAVAVLSIAWGYRLMGRISGLRVWNAVLAPVAALVFGYALVRSMAVTLARGGVVWRGTFYPLAELRKHSEPLLRAPRR